MGTKIFTNECPKCGIKPFKADIVTRISNRQIRVKCLTCHREIIIDIKLKKKRGKKK